MRKLNFLFLLTLITLVSCSKKEESFEYTKVISEMEYLNQLQLEQASRLALTEQYSLNQKSLKTGRNTTKLSDGICRLMNEEGLSNPFEFEKYFSKDTRFEHFQKYINAVDHLSLGCLSSQIVIDHYPISIIKLNLSEGKSLYGFLRVDKEEKIKTYYFIPSADMHVAHKFVPMSDGESISTLSFTRRNSKQPSIFLKTPYLHTGSFGYYVGQALGFFKMNMNVVIQSNRGSHASTGDFKWLHEKNIEDSKEAIEWITKQKESNGKVISYGVSYDGYNALAAAASNAKGLVSTIACSAPSNSKTDSFSAGKTVEPYLLNYIAERENRDQIHLFIEKFNYLLSKNVNFEDFDNELYGRDISDWSDLTEARKNGRLSSYFADRSILEELKDSRIPIFHIAGTKDDQDSRDTILAYEYLKRESSSPDKNYLYLHHEGHGCGSFFETSIAYDFITENYEVIKEEYRERSNGSVTSSSIKDDFENLTLELSSNDSLDTLNNRSDLLSGKELHYVVSLDEDVTVNGPVKLKFSAKSSIHKSALIVSLFYSHEGGWEIPHSMASGLSRSSIYFEDSSEGEYTLTLPPMLFDVERGGAVLVSLSLSSETYIDFFSKERENYYEKNADAGFLEIISGSVELTLPVEVKEEKNQII